jgi:hypothetical protein
VPAERHGALVIIVLGESVADIGIGAEGHAVTISRTIEVLKGESWRHVRCTRTKAVELWLCGN